MFEKFLQQAAQIVAQHEAQYHGVYYMKGGIGGAINKVLDADKKILGGDGWNAARDTLETGAVIGGNYLLPGSSLLTSHLASKGSKDLLNSGVGKIGQVVSGLGGAGVGSSVTGVPSAAAVGAGWGNTAAGVGSAASSAGDALGIGSGAAEAGAEGGSAAPWINPDMAVSPGASAASAAPWVDPDIASNVDAAGNPIMGGVNPNNLTAGNAANSGLSAGENNFLAQATQGANTPITPNTVSSLGEAAAGTASGGGGFWKSVAPAIGPAIAGTGLALSAIKGNQPAPGENELKTQAAQNAAQGEELKGYLNKGTLPPGAQAGIDQAKNSAKATIRSKYASMGMSGSSSEQQELAAIDTNAQAKGEELALQLLNSGIQESQLSSQLYQNILNGELQKDQNLSSAIGNFASSIGGAVNHA